VRKSNLTSDRSTTPAISKREVNITSEATHRRLMALVPSPV
jgi:hypothetical protein